MHDSKLLDRTLAQIVVKRPEATLRHQQYLCLDAGYPVSKIARKYGYYLGVKSRAEERLLKYRYPDSKPRRWVVERTTPGSIAIANCWSASKRQKPATWHSCNWPPP